MSKREAGALPLSDAEHGEIVGALLVAGAEIVQETNKHDLGGSQIWFSLNGDVFKAILEKPNGPLKDLSGKNKTFKDE